MIKFVESTLREAIDAGCDCAQIKYDGIFAQFATAHGEFSAVTGEKRDPDRYNSISDGITCTLIGCYLPTIPRFFVHDCWLVEEPEGNVVDLRHEGYRTRYVAARLQVLLLKGPFQLVQNHPIGHAPSLWESLGEVPHAKGIVFRRSTDQVGVQLRCVRWYPELPKDLT